MPQLKTGGEATVEALIAHGVDTLFGLPGVQNDWLYNALFDNRDQIRVIHTRHEEGAAYMAFGAAAATGQPAVFSVVPGPGLLNAGAALASAYAVNAPVFCIAGQIHSARIGKGMGDLHEIAAPVGGPARADQVERPGTASGRCRAQGGAGILRDALGAAAAGRAGDPARCLEAANRSARETHAHPAGCAAGGPRRD